MFVVVVVVVVIMMTSFLECPAVVRRLMEVMDATCSAPRPGAVGRVQMLH